METVKNILAGMGIVVPILLGIYGLFAWVGANGLILTALAICILWLCGAVGDVLRSRWKATS